MPRVGGARHLQLLGVSCHLVHLGCQSKCRRIVSDFWSRHNPDLSCCHGARLNATEFDSVLSEQLRICMGTFGRSINIHAVIGAKSTIVLVV